MVKKSILMIIGIEMEIIYQMVKTQNQMFMVKKIGTMMVMVFQMSKSGVDI